MSEVIFLSNVRLSFPNIVQPQRRPTESGEERVSYNCELLMPADHPGLKQFMTVAGGMVAAKWPEHASSIMQMIQNDRKFRCYGNGDEKLNKKTFKPYEGYAGNCYITAGRDTQPQIIQADGTAIDPSNSMAYQQLTRKMYGGCYVNAAVRPWLQDNKHGRAIRCDLIALQFAKDGEAFGEGVTDASNLFGAVAGGAAPAAPAAAAMPLPPFMQG